MSVPKTHQKKTVLITGCTPGGIGHALCLEYHKRGLHVIATARRPEVLAGLAEMGMTALRLDVTDEASIGSCSEEVARVTGGKLDILVNNAGLTPTYPATDQRLADVRAVFESTVIGAMAMVSAHVGLLVAAGGLVVNVSSAAAHLGYVFGTAYAAAKGAVVSYSRALRLELAPLGVRVMCVLPGVVRTNITYSVGPPARLPAASRYRAVEDLYLWRAHLNENSGGGMPVGRFAEAFAAASLRPEYPGFLRTWLGRPDWFWCGGSSTVIWLASSMGEWFNDLLCFYMFRMPEVEKVLRDGKEKREN
ncbi:NAD(P)-binding protein [Xylariomycetidae sp. FL2044]|nr:NAD(P)-binding protein [Xylariomycetidae sp. FL2044]